MKGLIVTGTDTGIGKTLFAAGLAGVLRRRAGAARYWKPVQAGLEGETDSEAVMRLAPGVHVHREAWRLTVPASPHLAAAIDGVVLVPEQLVPPEGEGPLVIEGAGGALVPLTVGPSGEAVLFADVFARWGLPAIIVARTGLGTINHTLLTVEALRTRGCILAGIVFIGEAHEDNERIIPAIAGVRRLGRLPWLPCRDAGSLAEAMAGHFDLADFLR